MESEHRKTEALMRRLADGQGGEPLTPEETAWLAQMKERYPFLALPNPAAGEQGEAATADVIGVASPEVMARLAGDPEVSRFDNFYPSTDTGATPTTNAAIDDFLSTYGHRSAQEDELLERLIFNPVADYSQQLAREEADSLPSAPAGENDSQDARLDRFILSHHKGGTSAAKPASPSVATPSTPSTPSTPAPAPSAPASTSPDGLLTESLAKIYIKTHRYAQAYEILNGLSLRFPEKSAYFADQLRFLRKLIKIEEYRNSHDPSLKK